MRKISATILLIAFVLAVQGYAQSITGSINGRVVDPQGSAVPNARVTAFEPTKNTTAFSNSTGTGDFSIAGLAPGTYTVTVEAQGFKKLTRPDVVLNASDKIALGEITLAIGAVTETIEVSATAVTLQTDSVERGTAVTGTQIANLEVDGRSPLDMAKLIAGIQFTNGASYAIGNAATGANNFTANGARPSQNQVTINGIGDVDTGNNGGLNASVSNDSIAEFKVLTGTYQAEFGRSAGAQIQLVTKSGSTQFHGSGYLYHRNEGMNANTFLNNIRPQFGLSATPKPLFRYNDPGYTFGGPIPIKKWNLKNKLFFFWSQEWQLQLVPNTARNVLVPTALERKGDFSQSLSSANRQPVKIYDPTNGQLFPGSVIPANRIWAPGQALLNIFPMPNQNLVAGTNLPAGATYNYQTQLPGTSPRREDLARLDYNLTEKIRVFGHYIKDISNAGIPYGTWVLGINPPIAPISEPIPGNSLAGGMTFMIRPTMTNEFNLGYTNNSINIFAPDGGLSQKTLLGSNKLPVLYPDAVQEDYIPNVGFGGNNLANSSGFGSTDAPFINYNTTIDLTDSLTAVWRTHIIKAGFYMQRSRKDQTSFGAFNGSYNFGDSNGPTGSNPLDTGYGYANALLGVYNSFNQAQHHINGLYRYWNIEQYVQDTWKITPHLTLDYGLRAAWYQPQYDAGLQASSFETDLFNPAKASKLYLPAVNPANNTRSAYDPISNTYRTANFIGLMIPGSGDTNNGICQSSNCNKYLTKDRGLQWGPRFGIAWDVTGKQDLVIRTGAGVYYDRIQGNRTFDMVQNPPEAFSVTTQYGYAQQLNPATAVLSPPTAYEVDPTGKIPTTYSYQFSVQKRLPMGMILDVAYVGSASRHQQDNRNLNWSPFGTTWTAAATDPTAGTGCIGCSPALGSGRPLGSNALPQNFMSRYQGYGNINLYESAATANYNSLQVQVQRRAAKGLFLGVAYTWSKAMATALSGGTNDNSFVRPDQYNRLANYSPASFDRRQVLAINYVYTLPVPEKFGNAVTRLFTNGWQLSGVTMAQTGAVFTPGVSVQNSSNAIVTGSYTEGWRPAIVPGCDPYTHSGNWTSYLNPSCFIPASIGSMGLESGINYLHGPGLVNFDMAVQKEFAVLKEGRVRFQFRADAFNVFNHTIFTGVNSSLAFTPFQANSAGIVTGPPAANAWSSMGYTSTALAVNTPAPGGCSGLSCTQIGGFGSLNQSGPGTIGYSRILQLMVRVTF